MTERDFRELTRRFTEDGRFNLVIEPTVACPSDCAICGRRNMTFPQNRHIQREVLDKVMSDLKEGDLVRRINRVHLAGWGEPLFYPGIFGLIDELSRLGLKVNTNINGAFLDEKKILSLLNTGIDSISYSLNAPDEHTFDRLMVPGRFAASLKNLRFLLEERARMRSGAQVTIQVVNPWDRDPSPVMNVVEGFLKDERVNMIFRELENLSGLSALRDYPFRQNSEGLPCSYLWRLVTVDCDGDVYYCCAGSLLLRRKAALFAGSIMEKSLADFLDHEKRKYCQDLMESGQIHRIQECSRCNTPVFLA